MRYNAFFKFLAIVLSVVCVVCGAFSGLGVIINANYGLYSWSPEEQKEYSFSSHGAEYGEYLAEQYAYLNSGMPLDLWKYHCGNGYLDISVGPRVDYILTVVMPDGSTIVEDHRSEHSYYDSQEITITRSLTFAVRAEDVPSQPTDATVPVATYDPESTEPTVNETTEPLPTENVQPQWLPDGVYVRQHVWSDSGIEYILCRYEEPVEFEIQLYYTQSQYQRVIGASRVFGPLANLAYQYRYESLAVLVGSALVLLVMMLYLAFAAGRKPGSDEINPRGMNRIPLDLYTGVDIALGIGLVWVLFMTAETALSMESFTLENALVLTLVGVASSAGIGLVCILYWCAFWAQMKTPRGFWWKNSLVGRFGAGVWGLFCALVGKLLSPFTRKKEKKEKGPTLAETIRDFHDKLPLMWQWLTASLGMFVCIALFGPMCQYDVGVIFYLVLVVFGVLAILYGARAFGTLRDGAKRMSRGELDVKIDADALEGCFHDFACDLNALSEACIVAAREQLKSERMKTELITNVSHDIKTPLTSIINYVDLLQKAQTEEQRKEYLAVLERQSARLKKLIEDLMEMSKASSGNVSAEITSIDVTESVNQALGEYADRLAERKLNVHLRKPETPVYALCDGRLLWRVLSNVMTNVVKYAMPGTRVYLDLTATENKVQLAMKNISAEELNITAEELLERFVRGDESRNTEGNGLGLNIARSLMEVQKGTLDLVVDGDLFKVVLTLPAGKKPEENASEA